MDPLRVIAAAIQHVPAVAFALGLAGIAAAASIVALFVGKGPAPITTMSAMLIGMVMLLHSFGGHDWQREGPVRLPAQVILWAVTYLHLLYAASNYGVGFRLA